jgi:hypothetical protein
MIKNCGFEIVDPRSNGEAVFSVFLQKMAFGFKKDKMVTDSRPRMHLQKASELSRQRGPSQGGENEFGISHFSWSRVVFCALDFRRLWWKKHEAIVVGE